VGVYATAAKTPLIFRQIVGRFVRTIPTDRRSASGAEPSWLYLPADPTLRAHASEVETELRHALHRDELEEGWDEPLQRRASEPSPTTEFVPLSAEFAAQMTLFGPPQRAHSPSPASAAEQAPEPAPVAAFERQAQLRQERSRLVAELHRHDGRSHREINAWVNRTAGLERVETASIKQLERSIHALTRELTRGSRPSRT
jgi:hypothetical protein